MREDEEDALALYDVDTGQESLLSTPTPVQGSDVVFACDWTPDGRSILARPGCRGHQKCRWAFGLSQTRPGQRHMSGCWRRIPHFNLFEAGFSPDGRWIVFNAFGGDNVEVITVIPAMGADRPHWTSITGPHDWADKPRWSPDGTHIYFTMLRDSFWNLWGIRFDQTSGRPIGAPFQVTHFNSPGRQISPDYTGAEVGIGGGRLVLPMLERTGTIWMLDDVNR